MSGLSNCLRACGGAFAFYKKQCRATGNVDRAKNQMRRASINRLHREGQLGKRAYDALKDAGVTDLGQLGSWSDDELLALPNVGKATVRSIRSLLRGVRGGQTDPAISFPVKQRKPHTAFQPTRRNSASPRKSVDRETRTSKPTNGSSSPSRHTPTQSQPTTEEGDTTSTSGMSDGTKGALVLLFIVGCVLALAYFLGDSSFTVEPLGFFEKIALGLAGLFGLFMLGLALYAGVGVWILATILAINVAINNKD